MEPRRLLALCLNRLEELRPRERLLLLERLGGPEELLRLNAADAQRLIGRALEPGGFRPGPCLARAERDARDLTMGKFQCTFYWEPGYPPQLREIYDPPVALYWRGALPSWSQALVAVVGTRHPSGAARKAAFALGYRLAALGAVSVSGLARGIDSEAHRGSLDAQGPTVAVLGSGVDEIFPESSKPLARKLLSGKGSLCSEYPPGVRARPQNFPARNRIISGLSRAVVVVQAPRRSGALITAEYALEQGRELLVHAAGLAGQSGAGTRALWEEGAAVIARPADVDLLLRDTAMAAAAVSEQPASFQPGELQLELGHRAAVHHGVLFQRGEHEQQR